MSDELPPTVRLFSHEDDTPVEARGALIPRSIAIDELVMEKDKTGQLWLSVRKVAQISVVPVVSMAVLALAVFTSYTAAVESNNVASLPSITIVDPYADSQIKLGPGPQAALTQPGFFVEVRDAMISESQTFLEVDMAQEVVRHFEEGVLLQQVSTEAVGAPGSWWDMPSGLYQVTDLRERHFSQYTQTYFPWAIVFEGNYMIHGVPEYPSGQTVDASFDGGGVRIATDAAAQLYEAITVGTTVLVRAAPERSEDDFVYAPVGPTVTANQYLVADVDSGTVVAAQGADEVVPIASLTKLMTAVVAAEKINLDERVYVAAPSFVQSLVPRLVERTSVSMYSLLQLLLVESSNEAAEVIAGKYGRSAFIAEMNEKARLIGMFDSNFDDPSGLSSDNRSSVTDLLELTKYIRNKRNFIFEITKSGEATGVVGGGEFGGLNNFNEIEEIENFVGGKIGETQAAGMTSVSLHEVEIDGQTRTLAVILLGSSARNDDVRALLDFVDATYE